MVQCIEELILHTINVLSANTKKLKGASSEKVKEKVKTLERDAKSMLCKLDEEGTKKKLGNYITGGSFYPPMDPVGMLVPPSGDISELLNGGNPTVYPTYEADTSGFN